MAHRRVISLQLSCRRALCGTCSASSAPMATSPKTKNISMIKCFRVFSEVIAFVCIGWRFAAVRTLLPSHHWIDAASARANEVGEASIARFVPPAFPQGISEGSDLSPLKPRPEGFLLPNFDSSAQAAPHARRDDSLRYAKEEPTRCGSSGFTHHPALTQMGPTTDPPGAAFVGTNRLFAGLVLHRVRPRDRSVVAPKQRIGSTRTLNPGPALVPATRAESGFTLGSEQPWTSAPAASSGPPLAPIVTLLAELARRRLRSFAAKKRT